MTVAPELKEGWVKAMRGFRVTWSPDNLASEGVRARPDVRNPEAIELFANI
jgi:hypothetical protein